MAALSFFHSNWPTTPSHHHNTAVIVPPPPPDFLPFNDNNNNNNNNAFFTSNNLAFHNSNNFPTLSSSSFYNNNYNNDDAFSLSPLTNLAQECYNSNNNNVFFDDHENYFLPYNPIEECYSNPLFVPNNNNVLFDDHENYFLPIEENNNSYYESYPFVHDIQDNLCPPNMDQIMHEPELSLPENIYDFGYNNVCDNLVIDHNVDKVMIKEKPIINGNYDNGNRGKERISAQSMAARTRRRKISEKTLELGKLVPGGHKMTTAEMFQAAYKYIQFLQAQVGVLQHMSSSPELGEELQAFVTSPAVQEKLYNEGNCIVSQTLAKTIAN